MIETKLFEVRDCGTHIPCFGVKCDSDRPMERECKILQRAGFGDFQSDSRQCVIFGSLTQPETSHYDVYEHKNCGARTIPTAHEYVAQHWNELESGAVICVEHILGERDTPKETELK